MPFEFLDFGAFYHFRLHGILTNADLKAVLEEVGRIEAKARRYLDRIIDSSEVTHYDIRTDDIIAFLGQRAAISPRNAFKLAVIVRKGTDFGIARMFQTINTSPLIDIRIVHGQEEAEDWFREGSPPPA